MRVLRTFETTQRDLTLAEVARRSGLDRATARRLVLTLEHLGYVRQRGKTFTLTPKVLLLAGGFLQSRQFTRTVVPILNQHSADIGAAIYLAMLDDMDAVYLAHASLEPRAISFGFSVGSRLPVLHTAIGRALLAGLSDGEARQLLDEAPATAMTVDTVLDRLEIANRVAAVRHSGIAFVDNEFEAGVAALAVPLNPGGGAPAAIGISADRTRFTADYRNKAADALRACRRNLMDAVEVFD